MIQIGALSAAVVGQERGSYVERERVGSHSERERGSRPKIGLKSRKVETWWQPWFWLSPKRVWGAAPIHRRQCLSLSLVPFSLQIWFTIGLVRKCKRIKCMKLVFWVVSVQYACSMIVSFCYLMSKFQLRKIEYVPWEWDSRKGWWQGYV